jgi:hypothetical protein
MLVYARTVPVSLHTTTFRHALGALRTPAKSGTLGLRILALRTSKADTCVELRPGKEEIDPCGTRMDEKMASMQLSAFATRKAKLDTSLQARVDPGAWHRVRASLE